jgi:hypothetical protein
VPPQPGFLCYAYPMSDEETPPATGGEAPKNKGGRPRNPNGVDPTRSAGRHGKIWDDCMAQAKADGQTMTLFVGEAITRELARRQRAARTEQANAALAPVTVIETDTQTGESTEVEIPGELAARIFGRAPAAPADAAARHVIAQAAGAAADRVVGFEVSSNAVHEYPPRRVPMVSVPTDPMPHEGAPGPVSPPVGDTLPYDVTEIPLSPGYDTDGDDPPAFPDALTATFEQSGPVDQCATCGMWFDTPAERERHESEPQASHGQRPL